MRLALVTGSVPAHPHAFPSFLLLQNGCIMTLYHTLVGADQGAAGNLTILFRDAA
jgi:hypothetical protein